MTGYEQQIMSVDGSQRDVHFEVRHDDGSGTAFYDTAVYDTPRGDYQVYEDKDGHQWFAIHGDSAVERRPVYENGKPVYDGENVKSVSVETVRYKSTPRSFENPERRSDTSSKPPRKKINEVKQPQLWKFQKQWLFSFIQYKSNGIKSRG